MVDNLIRLFNSTENDFSTNGLGVLIDAESCVVTEEKNGEFELELTYPITGKRYSDISLRKIIVTKSNPYSEPQPFRIYSISKPINGVVTINAEHISYDMSGYPVSPFTANSCSETFSKIKANCEIENCPFIFWTDKNVEHEFIMERPYNMRSLLGGTEGSILDIFGKGEYEFDRYFVKLWLNRGTDRGVTIRYGKNLTDVKQDENCSSVYTGVYPYWYAQSIDKETQSTSSSRGPLVPFWYEDVKDVVSSITDGDDEELEQDIELDTGMEEGSQLVVLPEKIIRCEGSFEYEKILTLDLSDNWTEKPTEEDLRAAAQKYITDNKIGVPKISLEVSFEQLSQTEEYKTLALLEEIRLCDTVSVEFTELGINAKSQCVKTEYDALTNKYTKLTLGESNTNLAATISNQEKEIEESIDKSFLEKTVDKASRYITGNTGGYVVIRNSEGKGHPNEILIMDTPDINTANKVWRWNQSGFGYCDNYRTAKDFNVAITMDGEIVADFIKTGILNAITINACNIQCGEIDGDTMSKYAFALSRDGTIEATKGIIGGCVIDEEGNLIVPAAHIKGKLTAGEVGADTLEVDAAIITGELNGNQITAKNLTLTSDDILNNFSYNISPSSIQLKRKIHSNGDTTEEVVLEANQNGITMTGTITAKSGNIGGFNIGAIAIYKNVTSMMDSEHSGIYLGTDGIRLGLKDSFSVTDSGVLKSTKGTIGGWNIVENTLSCGNVGLYSGSSSTKTSLIPTLLDDGNGNIVKQYNQSPIRFWSGSNFAISGKFIVLDDGSMFAESAKISGEINADSGKIGSWTINNDGLYCNNSGLNNDNTKVKNSLIYPNETSPIRLYCGKGYENDGKFIVLDDGSMYAEGARISGEINADSGNIAGLTITRETKVVDGISVYGNVLKTDDGAFSIFSYSEDGVIKSSLNVQSINIKNPVINEHTSLKSLETSSVKVGDITIEKGYIYYDGEKAIRLNYVSGGTSYTAEIIHDNMSASVTLKLKNNAVLPENKIFDLKLHYTWGDWMNYSITLPANTNSITVNPTPTPFWGFNDAYFINSNEKTYNFTLSGTSYIEFLKSIEPYNDNVYDCGSDDYRWRCVYTHGLNTNSVNCTNFTKSSDVLKKFDISILSDEYEQFFDKLNPVTYRYKENPEKEYFGFIAQEVYQSMFDSGLNPNNYSIYQEWFEKNEKTCGIQYTEFIALIVYEIKKLKQKIIELEKTNKNID